MNACDCNGKKKKDEEKEEGEEDVYSTVYPPTGLICIDVVLALEIHAI